MSAKNVNSKVTFKINKELDFENHLIGAKRIPKYPEGVPSEIVKYFKTLKNANNKQKRIIFEKRVEKFYSKNSKTVRALSVIQIQEMWDLIENKYFGKIEKIHKRKFPFRKIMGVLSTAPMIYGYDFTKKNPWFACPYDSPIRAVNVAMHEMMHTFFQKYFWEEYKNKFKLNNKQIWDVKEALTVLLNLEFKDIKTLPDKCKPGHEKLRAKIEEDWLKYKDIEKVLEGACLFVKVQ